MGIQKEDWATLHDQLIICMWQKEKEALIMTLGFLAWALKHMMMLFKDMEKRDRGPGAGEKLMHSVREHWVLGPLSHFVSVPGWCLCHFNKLVGFLFGHGPIGTWSYFGYGRSACKGAISTGSGSWKGCRRCRWKDTVMSHRYPGTVTQVCTGFMETRMKKTPGQDHSFPLVLGLRIVCSYNAPIKI